MLCFEYYIFHIVISHETVDYLNKILIIIIDFIVVTFFVFKKVLIYFFLISTFSFTNLLKAKAIFHITHIQYIIF